MQSAAFFHIISFVRKHKIEKKQIRALLLVVLLLSGCATKEKEGDVKTGFFKDLIGIITSHIETVEPKKKPEEEFRIKNSDLGYILYNASENFGYRYGPSIIENEDGSFDAWFSSPGNSNDEWDWIVYRHSYDGVHWDEESVVLRPTPDSKDSCSVCDPGVICFNGYYYLAYTSTNDYERNGYNNSIFVARSMYPDGPFEKWNGSGWGGNPEPIIAYEGDPSYWGIGEPSFVIKENELYLYYSHTDSMGSCTRLAKADLSEDWPFTIEDQCMVFKWKANDSLDVVYAEDIDRFLAFTIKYRMDTSSQLILLVSSDGKEFVEADWTKDFLEEYAHNCGVSKRENGHIVVDDDEPLIGFAYGKNWGRWATKIARIWIKYSLK